MVFALVVYGCESWNLKKAECWRIDAFEVWCWRRLLRVPWTACKEIQPVHPKGGQSWIFIGRTDAETPILWPPDVKNWLKRKDPDAGKDWRQEEKGDNRGWDGWMTSLTQWTSVWANSRRWWRIGNPSMLQSMISIESDKAEGLSNKLSLIYLIFNLFP